MILEKYKPVIILLVLLSAVVFVVENVNAVGETVGFDKLPSWIRLQDGSKLVDDETAKAKFLFNDSGYNILGLLIKRNGNFDESIKLSITVKKADSNMCPIGAICYMSNGWKLDSKASFNLGWNKLPGKEYSVMEFEIAVPDRLHKKGKDLYIMIFRSMKRGAVKIKQVKYDYFTPLIVKKKKTGISAKPESDGEVFRHTVFPPGQGDSIKVNYFPIGVYCPGTLSRFKKQAELEGVSERDIAAKMFSNIRGMGANTVYFQGTSLGGNGTLPAIQTAKLASEAGLKVIGQMDDVYFRYDDHPVIKDAYKLRPSTAWNYFKRIITPRLKKYLPAYRNNRYIYGWSPVEELDHKYVWHLAEYRRQIWELNPDKIIYELLSDNRTAETLKIPYPNLLGVDRYPCVIAKYNGVKMLWTPDLALSWLRGAIRPFFNAAEKYDRPCVYVMQGVVWFGPIEEDKLAKWPEIKDISTKSKEEKQKFVTPLNPTLKYYPELDRFATWSFFYPPENGIRAMCWVGILEGAKGLFVWSYRYRSPKQITGAEAVKAGKTYRAALHKGTKAYEDTKKGFKEIEPFGNLLIALKKSKANPLNIDDKDIWYSMFVDREGNEFAVIMNSKIATWDNTSPKYLDFPKTKLTVDDNGYMTNYTSVPAKTFTVSITEGKEMFSLRNEIPFKNISSGKYELTLEPGQGTVVYIGKKNRLKSIIRSYF